MIQRSDSEREAETGPMSMLLVALSLMAGQPRSARPTECAGTTTPAVEDCLKRRLTAAQSELDRYERAARRRD